MHNMRKSAAVLTAGALVMVTWTVWAQSKPSSQAATSANDQIISNNAQSMLEQGREIFRFDTFGDEAFWGDTLRLHQAIAGEKQGGVGPGVSPKTALAVDHRTDPAIHPRFRPASGNDDNLSSSTTRCKSSIRTALILGGRSGVRRGRLSRN